MKRVLLTGGAGFIGSHTVEHILKNTDWEIVVMDRLSYAGSLEFINDIDIWDEQKHRVRFIFHDFRAKINDTNSLLIGDINYIIHMGAESHVDRSITDPYPFVASNVLGTVNMLEYAKTLPDLEKFIYISTDEVYGPAHKNADGVLHLHQEGEPHWPSNPYSASKSGAEAFCIAYFNTHEVPVIISNTMNNFGERQNGEKFLPLVVKSALRGDVLTLHAEKNEAGEVIDVSSRCWLHARNHADGILFLLENGTPGEKYNITGAWASVQDIADMVAEITGNEVRYNFVDFHSFRKGHDMHYGLDGGKMEALGWVPPFNLHDSLEHTVKWMADNPKWL